MINNSSNFPYYGFQYPFMGLSSLQPFASMNYQQFTLPSCFWVDQNSFLQQYQNFATYGLQPFSGSQAAFLDRNPTSTDPNTQESSSIRNLSQNDQLHFCSKEGKYNEKGQKVFTRSLGAFTYWTNDQQNQKPEQKVDNKDTLMPEKQKYNLNNDIMVEDKKSVQNLRYQRKNIEANIVNKIYTHLKTILKLGQKSAYGFSFNKEKLILCFKVLEKLEKAKKQVIKRQFIRALMSMDQSLPGYSKIVKELQKKGQSIRQFEYYIRVIIRNYLRNEACNSILTSKKMNPELWMQHLRKVREIQEYLFDHAQKQKTD